MKSKIFGIDIEEYKDLLSCNINGIDATSFENDILEEEHQIYHDSIKDWSNYGFVDSLEGWVVKDHEYPVIHPTMKKILDEIKAIKPASVCEIGAGAGVVSKFVYDALKSNVELHCVEGSPQHLSQMRENFKESSIVIAPQIEVKANIIEGTAQNIPLPDNSVDVVYTCTVMMHIPFLMIPAAAKEIARISSGYIIHSENHNNFVNTVTIGNQKSKLNLLQIDYPTLYQKLGIEEIKYEEAEEYNNYYKNPTGGKVPYDSALLYVGRKPKE